MNELGMIAIILIASTLVGALFKRAGLPAVVGQLLVGIILGPAILKIIQPTHSLEFIAEIGVIFLMFIAGLESDVELLKRYMKPAITVAIFGVVFPLVAFTLVANLLHYNFTQSVFFGIVYAATSVSITVEVLQEFKRLNTKEGATIMGAAVVDDVMAVLLLSIFLTIFGTSAPGESSLPLNISLPLQLAYLVFIFATVKYFAPAIMKFADKLPIFASATIGAVVICLGMAELAEFCGLSDVIGAFFAGVAVSQTNVKEKIDGGISVLGYAFFIPVFFASIGLKMSFTGMFKALPILIGFTILAILTKLVGSLLAARLTKFSWSSGYTIGAGMVSRGEMALIVAQLGLSGKIIQSAMYSELVVVIILTTLIAPFLLKHSFKFNPLEK
jgi:monovalent cation:proton antiporter-2 (CPA2) family protein